MENTVQEQLQEPAHKAQMNISAAHNFAASGGRGLYICDMFSGVLTRQQSDTPAVAYFLSHYHSDHYRGIVKQWPSISGARGRSATPPIPFYASQFTIECLRHYGYVRMADVAISVKPFHYYDLPGNSKGQYDRLLVLPAGHTPGSLMFLFFITERREIILYTGDFRFTTDSFPYMKLALTKVLRAHPLTHLYVDTTFRDTSFNFPTQSEILSELKNDIESVRKVLTPPILFIVPSYSIGKEKVAMAVAVALGEPFIYVGKEGSAGSIAKERCINQVIQEQTFNQDLFSPEFRKICGEIMEESPAVPWKFPDGSMPRPTFSNDSTCVYFLANAETGHSAIHFPAQGFNPAAGDALVKWLHSENLYGEGRGQFRSVCIVSASGWLFKKECWNRPVGERRLGAFQKVKPGMIMQLSAGYSEHCSSQELCEFLSIASQTRIAPVIHYTTDAVSLEEDRRIHGQLTQAIYDFIKPGSARPHQSPPKVTDP